MSESPSQNKDTNKKKRKPFRLVKRLFLVLFILIVLAVGALFAIPVFFKDQVLEAVKGAANDNLYAEVDFADASLSFFREFPKLTLSLEDYSVSNKAPFEGIKLAAGKRASLSFDIMSVIKADRPLSIHSVDLEDPIIEVIVLEDGRANYDIALPADSLATDTSSSESGGTIEVELDNYRISNAQLIYDDRSTDMYVAAKNLNHSGSGKFNLDVYDLDTQTNIDALTFEYDGISYFNQTKVDMDAGFLINLTDQQYTLKDNVIKLNALHLEAAGFVSLPDAETIDMDLSFKAPGNEFGELLSLIPNAYIEGYEDVKASGNFALEGSIQGALKGADYPAMDMRLTIDKGGFQYPDLPLGITDIQTNVRVEKPQGDLDALKVLIPDFQMRVGGELLTGHFNLATPMSDPNLDTHVNGQLNLRDLADAYPMEGVSKMAGSLTADISAKARLSQLTNEDYENVDVQGSLDLANFEYDAADMPAVNISSAGLDFSPQMLKLRKFNALIGSSDFEMEGEIRNFLAYFSPTEAVTGNMYLRSRKLDLNELAGSESTEAAPASSSTQESASTDAAAPFDRFDFQLDAAADQVIYDTYDLRNTVVKGRVSANRSDIETFAAQIDDSDIRADGYITNTWAYLFEEGTLGGQINLYSNYLNLNPFMEESPESASTETTSGEESDYGVILVPDNINMAINAKMGKIIYTDLELTDFSGTLRVADETVSIENCQTKVLGGKVDLAGAYDTQDPKEPYFNFKYDIQNFDFNKTFNTFNTFQTLAPIGKWIEGNFNSSLIMEGTLDENLSPVYTSLSADGFLQTYNAYIQGFPPLQKLSNSLNLEFLKNLDLQDTKNWFEFSNGNVEVKEFDISQGGVDMRIGGTHSITQDINYNILAKVPREMLTSNAVGAAADSGLDMLRSQASKLGVNLDESEFVNLDIQLTGSISDPKINVKLLGTDGNASLADAAKDKAKEALEAEKAKLEAEAKARLEAEKEKLAEEAEKLKDEATQKVTERVDDVKEAAKEEIEEKAGEAADKLKDQLDDKAKEGVEDIQNKLEEFNPFKKKKKKEGN
ncbi:MAG: hypothetical protein GYB31_19490 [Bacteroidetes bacterium]|nr:hypothetical protein [Bacteroidota bacterium]